MALDPAAVAVIAAAKLKITEADALPASAAAVEYIADYVGITSDLLPADNPQLNIGAPLLAVRIYQDAAVPSGSTSSFDAFTGGVFIPRHLYSHLEEYWSNLPGASRGFA